MALLLFKLHNVPEDEAADIRALLSENGIDFYETTAGNWGLGLAAIWLTDAAHFPQARALIDTYQTERQRRVRAEHARAGRRRTVMAMVKEAPMKALLYLAAALAILYLTLMPFLRLMR